MSQKEYGQFCPVAQAAEVLAERWTPLIIRELCCGATRFNDLQRGLPRMSSALLARRLKELEHNGILRIRPAETGRGSEYVLTEAGAATFPIIEAMGDWASTWLRDAATADSNLNPDLLMWDVRRRVLRYGALPAKRRVVEFQFSGVPASKRFYWLALEAESADLCFRNPGHEIDLYVECHLRTLTGIWLGHLSIIQAVREGALRLDGDRAEIDAFGKWFTLSHFTPDAVSARAGGLRPGIAGAATGPPEESGEAAERNGGLTIACGVAVGRPP